MQLRTEIEINAPVSLVWQILVDGARYHEWNPFITSLDGELREGERLNVVVSPPDSSDFRFRPVVLACTPGKELRWRGTVISDLFFSGEHYFLLDAVGAER